MDDTVNLSLYKADIDLILDLITRKIEKAKSKEIDEIQIQYIKELESCKENILVQIS